MGRDLMTALPPDPDPSNVPTDAGGGVEPGETPPASAQTSASQNQDPPPRRRMTAMSVASIIAIAILAAMFLMTGVLLVLKMTGALGG